MRLLILLLIFLSNFVVAQTKPIVFIPLDSRPANATLPTSIGKMAGVEFLSPPTEMLGNATRAADINSIFSWSNLQHPEAIVVSLDAIVYGGLIQSRKSIISAEEAWQNLWPVWLWHLEVPVYAYVVIPRAPDAVNRERNLALIRYALAWAEDGTIRRLLITWDDALPGSPAPQEGAAIRDEVAARGLKNVFVYPGADEDASVLTASLLLGKFKTPPSVRVRFSDPKMAAQKIVTYEGQTLLQSVQQQSEAIGLTLHDEAQLELYVYNGGDARQAALEILADQRQGHMVALADVATVNKASPKLVRDLLVSGAFARLAGFAAWGTPGNNLGSALAMGSMFFSFGPSLASNMVLARAFVNDYLYSTVIRAELRKTRAETEFINFGPRQDLLAALQNALPSFQIAGLRFVLKDAYFPWGRSFEIGFDLEAQNILNTCNACPAP